MNQAFQYLILWAGLNTMGVILLFIEAALIVRRLFVAHREPVRYLLILLPLGVSAWSFFRIQDNVAATYTLVVPSLSLPRFPLDVYAHLQAAVDASVRVCQVQLLLIVVTFVLTLVLERRIAPRVGREPVWVSLRTLRRW